MLSIFSDTDGKHRAMVFDAEPVVDRTFRDPGTVDSPQLVAEIIRMQRESSIWKRSDFPLLLGRGKLRQCRSWMNATVL